MKNGPITTKNVLVALASLTLIGVLFYAVRPLVDLGAFEAYLGTHEKEAPLFYIAFYAIATVLFVPGTPLTLIGGALFGPVFGTLYTVLGASLGACGLFLATRYLRTFFTFRSDGALVERVRVYDEKLRQHGFVTVLFLRLVPLFPFNGVNAALGLTSVSFRAYALATVIGIVPGTFAYTYFGDSLASLNPTRIVIGVLAIGAVILLGRFIYKRSTATHTV